MGVDVHVAPKQSGLTTVLNVIAAPREAFTALRLVPTWGWAFIIAAILMIAGTALEAPAARHVGVAQIQRMQSTSPLFAQMSDQKKKDMIDKARKPSLTSLFFAPCILLLFALLNTLFMLIGNAVGRGSADFKRLWAGSMNIAVPTLGLGAVVTGLIVMLRGPDAFNSQAEMMRAMPGLGMLPFNGSAVLTTMLATISIFSIWGLFLNATMLQTTAGTSKGIAWTFAALVLLLGALASGAFAMIGQSFGVS